jgi:DNA-binding MarR family transcriptional regulator
MAHKAPDEEDGGRAANAGLSAEDPEARLDLASFLPYRLSVLQLAVSRSLALIYGRRFALSRHEWRALAVLAQESPLTSAEVAARTSMDKVQVSRAIAKLIATGRVARGTDPRDRRRGPLTPTPEGRAVYRRIVPLVKARERDLTSALTPAEARALDRIIDKLHRRALELQREGTPGRGPST